ncbi:DUF6325 family protein [Microbacterium pygmaeum]|uniref:DUF1269 domain-containing protein n=1 Tax=Microbacterium pygmaeum TaxID=370764 RepID=A0A1G7VS14_9MICO|nr:DUF6325 family protein [Microbacterium pygmaeum]SDG62487.1 hypothetical protein SAMN04489810_0808 [Microbacterium pygmaeum]
MAEFQYGPVELHLVGFEGDRPDPGVIAAIVELIEADIVRLLDFVIVSKAEDGTVTALEIEDETDRYGFGSVELAEIGITGEEDIEELAELIPPGASAAIVAYELVWAKRLAESFAASGGSMLRSERIPAPIVNALVEAAQEEESA